MRQFNAARTEELVLEYKLAKLQLKYAEPDRKSRDWLEYGCYCFSDVKTDILLPGIGKAIDPIGLGLKAY